MSTLEYLSRKLGSSDAEERREAVIDLGRTGKGAVPLLLRALGDTDWRVRKTAVEGLVSLGDDEVTNGLVQRLSSEDNAGARNSAIEALVQIGAAAVGPILQLLETRDPDVRKFAVDVLGDIRDARAVPGLMEKLKDHDENVRVAAAEALGKIRDRRAVDALIGCLSANDQSWLDYAAAEALGEIGDERALGPLLAALGRSSLREPVLESLGKIGNVQTLPPLINGLVDPLRIVREVSVVALAAVYRKSLPADRGTDQRCGPFRDRGPGVPAARGAYRYERRRAAKSGDCRPRMDRPSVRGPEAPFPAARRRDGRRRGPGASSPGNGGGVAASRPSRGRQCPGPPRRCHGAGRARKERSRGQRSSPCSMMRTDTSAAQQQSPSDGSGARKRSRPFCGFWKMSTRMCRNARSAPSPPSGTSRSWTDC